MSHQHLSPKDSINITSLLAQTSCISKHIQTIPNQKFQFKAYIQEQFAIIKKYEEGLNKMTNYNELEVSSGQQKEIYDMMMELTYDVRDAVLKKLENGNNNSQPTD